MSAAGYVPRHYAGLLAGASQRERDRRDHEHAQALCAAVDTAEALLLGLILSSWRAAVLAEGRANQARTDTMSDAA